MDTRAPLLFIALIPPDDIAAEVTAYKKLVARRYRSKRALHSPAHITLQAPFSWPEDRIGEIVALLNNFSKGCTPFSQELNGFDCFRPRVIFVKIVLNDSLTSLASRLKTMLTPLLGPDQIDNRPFHPHMTVAFKDLEPRQFHRAWEFFSPQPYHRVFEADALWLLRHTGNVWEPMQQFLFSTSFPKPPPGPFPSGSLLSHNGK